MMCAGPCQHLHVLRDGVAASPGRVWHLAAYKDCLNTTSRQLRLEALEPAASVRVLRRLVPTGPTLDVGLIACSQRRIVSGQAERSIALTWARLLGAEKRQKLGHCVDARHLKEVVEIFLKLL